MLLIKLTGSASHLRSQFLGLPPNAARQAKVNEAKTAAFRRTQP
jgi:hypothetical protein